jgi:hypothetical protein
LEEGSVKGLIRVKKSIAIGAVCLASTAAAVGATAANAHPGDTWNWSPKAAAQELVDSGLEWDEGTDDVTYARCTGEGPSIYNSSHTKRLYKHFRCFVETSAGEDYYIRFHVLDQYNFDYDFLRYA